jgi:Protein of unknown function (DUF3800)
VTADLAIGNVVGVDESGNTGEDLLNVEQPVYVLASVHLSADALKRLVPVGEPELHFKRDRRNAAGRAKIVEILNSPLLTSGTVKACVMHKPFFVTGKIVDLLIEPVMRLWGIDFYQDGMHLATANLLHTVWPVLSPAGFNALQAAFVDLCRNPSEIALNAFYIALDRVEEDCDGQADWVFPALRTSRTIGGADIVSQGRVFPSHLDPAATSLTGLLQEWALQLDSIEVHHDESGEIRRSREALELFWNQAAPALTLNLWNGETLSYPAPVAELRFVESHGSPLVQLADIIAGALGAIFRSLIAPSRDDQFAATLRETRALDWIIGSSVWPTHAIEPGELGAKPGASPWPADEMARWLANGGKNLGRVIPPPEDHRTKANDRRARWRVALGALPELRAVDSCDRAGHCSLSEIEHL